METQGVPAKDLIAECQSRGYLVKQLYVVMTTPANGMGPVMETLAAHLQFQEELEQNGVMFAAGPNWTDDEQSWEGDGLIVYRAESLADAEAIAARDPMHSSGARTFRVRPWLVNEGTITIKLGFATGRFQLA